MTFHRGEAKESSKKLVREVLQLSPATIDSLSGVRTPTQHIVQWLRTNGLAEGEYEIFTDGGWKDNTPFLTHCFY